MREELLLPRLHARKSRIHQRIHGPNYERKQFKLTRRATVEMAGGLMLLALLGAAALR